MRNFSIVPSSNQSVIEQYSDFLSREVYYSMPSFTYDNLNDRLFLQKLSVLQAEGIRRAINNNSAVVYEGFEETNATIVESTNYIGSKIGRAANMLTSSLDKGFASLNHSLVSIGSEINTANTHLLNINTGIHAVNDNLTVLGKLIGQGFSKLYYTLIQTNFILNDILKELKIPETQRERRYHIEEGTKYLTLALQNGNNDYFNDAYDEFNKALTFEKKDWYSWFNIGLIHLRSRERIDPQKAIAAFKETIHYCNAEAVYTKNANLEHKIDEAHLCLAESYYLQQEYKNAISETEACLHAKDKADFMKVKYLSATNDEANKQEAARILSKLIEEKPPVAMQMLQDDDILRNEFIDDLLEECRKKAVQHAKTLLQRYKQDMIPKSLVKKNIEKIEKLIQANTYLDAIEAVCLLDIYKKEQEAERRLFEQEVNRLIEYGKEQAANMGKAFWR